MTTKVTSKSRKADIYAALERARAHCADQNRVIAELRAQLQAAQSSAQVPTQRRAATSHQRMPTQQEIAAYVAAGNELKGATPAQIIAAVRTS